MRERRHPGVIEGDDISMTLGRAGIRAASGMRLVRTGFEATTVTFRNVWATTP